MRQHVSVTRAMISTSSVTGRGWPRALALGLLATAAAAGCNRSAPEPAKSAAPPAQSAPTPAPKPTSGPRIYVSDETGKDIVVVDPVAGEVVGRIEVGKRPRGVKLSKDGKQLLIALSGSPIGRTQRRRVEAAACRPRRGRHRGRRSRQRQGRSASSRAVRTPSPSTSRRTASSCTSRTRMPPKCRCSTWRAARSSRASRSAKSPKASPCGQTAGSST